jgi:hypothetical protein
MKPITFCKVILLLPGIVLSTALFAQKKEVAISIVQGSTVHTVANQEIYLAKKPFKILVTLKNLEGVYLYADFSDSLYKLEDTTRIPDFELLPPMAMAEATFNEDKELIINKDGWAFWFYDKKLDWHRFDKDVLITNDSIVGTKTVTRFYFTENEIPLRVQKVKQPLYLFFVTVDKVNSEGMPEKELMRMKVKINWE